MSWLGQTSVVALSLTLVFACPAAAQDNQMTAEATIAEPTDAQGLAPQAKITATWPLLEIANPNYIGGLSATAAQKPRPGQVPGPLGAGQQSILTQNLKSPFKYVSTPRPRPGQPVTLSSVGSTDVDGPGAGAGAVVSEGAIAGYSWVVFSDAGLEVKKFTGTGPTIEIPTSLNSTYVDATLTITGADGQTSTTKLKVPVVTNVPPVVELRRFREIKSCTSKPNPTAPTGEDLQIQRVTIPTSDSINGKVNLLPLLRNQGVTMYANACDPDGQVIRYEFIHRDRQGQPDGKPDLITDTVVARTRGDSLVMAATAKDEARGTVSFLVRAYDTEGGMSESEYKSQVTVDCVNGPQTLGYFTITPRGACVEKVTNGEILINRKGGSFQVNGLEFTVGPNPDIEGHSGRISYSLLNGQPARVFPSAPGAVSPTGAAPPLLSGPKKPPKGVGVIALPTTGITTALNASGARLDLPVTKKLEFDSNGFFVKPLPVKEVRFSGLAVTKIEDARIAVPGPTATLALFRAQITAQTPKEFGVGDSTTPANAFAFLAAGEVKASMAQVGAPVRLGPSDMEIGGIAIKDAYMELSAADSWAVAGSFFLDTPLNIGKINAAAGIQDGKFAFLDAEAEFPGPGVFIPPASLYVQALRFVLDFGSGKPTPCVPNVGKEIKRFKDVREGFLQPLGYSAEQAYKMAPDLEYDYGVPAFQACGAVKFVTTPNVPVLNAPVADGQVALGFADYTDRDDVFRVIGKPLKIVGVPAEVLFEAYSDGYINLDAKIKLLLKDALSVRAGLQFEAKLPKFNAGAYAEVCILVQDIGCASAQALVSSKGVGACFNFDFAFFEFSPGATYVFGGNFTPYLDGCDIGDVRVAIDGAGNVNVTKLPPGATGASAAQGKDTRFAPPTQGAPNMPELLVPADTTGAVFTVRGADNKLAKFQLLKPDGSVLIDVDDQPSTKKLLRPVEAGQPRVIKSSSTGITSILLSRPAVGTWKVRLASDSPQIIEASVGLGVPKPKVDYKLSPPDPNGTRTLTLAVTDRRKGIAARVVEDGATGGQSLGGFDVAANQKTTREIKFTPAATKAEPRTITVFVERNGLPVFSKRLGGSPRPGTPFKGTFPTAGPKPPAAPKNVVAKVQPGGVRVTWDKVPGARSYVVVITTNDGRRLRSTLKATSRTLALTKRMKIDKHDGVNVQVRAIGRGGKLGALGADLVKPRAAPPKRTLSSAERKALTRIR